MDISCDKTSPDTMVVDDEIAEDPVKITTEIIVPVITTETAHTTANEVTSKGTTENDDNGLMESHLDKEHTTEDKANQSGNSMSDMQEGRTSVDRESEEIASQWDSTKTGDQGLPLGEDGIQSFESSTDVAITSNNNHTLARRRALKRIHSRIKTQHQGIKPYICRLCLHVIWGKWPRYQQHLKAHHKQRRMMRPKSKNRSLRLSSTAKGNGMINSDEAAKKEGNVPVVQDSRPLKKRFSSMQIIHKDAESTPAKRTKGRGKAATCENSSTVEAQEMDLVSVPIHKVKSGANKASVKQAETNPNPALYLCAKCCQGFAEVIDLVNHVAVCTGEPTNEPDKKPKSKTKNSKLGVSKKAKPSGRGTTPRKQVVKTESKNTGSRTRKRGGVSKLAVKPEPVENESDDDNENHAEDMDWVPDGNIGANAEDEAKHSNEENEEKDMNWKPIVRNTRSRIKREGNENHVCMECGNTFTHRSGLQRHMALHSGAPRPHPCRLCARSFTQSCHLKNHMRKVHQNGAVKKEPGAALGDGVAKPRRRRAAVRSDKSEKRKKVSQSVSNPNNQCSVCNKTFSHRSALQRHSILHTGERRHQCHLCELKFTQSCHLKGHIDKVHLRIKPNRPRANCTVCEETFVTKRGLKLHMMRHNESKIVCEICKVVFTEDDMLMNHIEKVHDGKDKDASFTTCSDCGKVFSFPSSLRRHKLLHLDTKKYECETCLKKFSQKTKYMAHTCGIERSNLCVKCGKSFASATSMRKHELSVHVDTKDFKCPVCNKAFATYMHLKVHVGGAHGRGNHLCHQCGKSFSFKSSYLRHLKFHTGVKPYQCNFCERSFSQSSHCKSHEISHTNAPKQPCRYCGKKFKNIRNIKNHIKKHHRDAEHKAEFKCFRCGLVAEEEEELMKHMAEKCNDERHNTTCKLCKKSFTTNSHLVRHMRSHTNERPFRCNICDKTFTQNSHLKSHVMRHGKLKPWQCEVCGRSYSSREYLKQHVKKLHENGAVMMRGGADGGVEGVKKKKRTDCEFCGKIYKSRKYLKVHMKRKHMVGGMVMHQKQLTDPPGASSPAANDESRAAADAITNIVAAPPPPPHHHPEDKPHGMVIYPSNAYNRIQIPVDMLPPHTTAAGIAASQVIPHTSASVAPPQAGFLTEMQDVKEQSMPRKPEEVQHQQHQQQQLQQQQQQQQQAPNMIADSMRLITVNWW